MKGDWLATITNQESDHHASGGLAGQAATTSCLMGLVTPPSRAIVQQGRTSSWEAPFGHCDPTPPSTGSSREGHPHGRLLLGSATPLPRAQEMHQEYYRTDKRLQARTLTSPLGFATPQTQTQHPYPVSVVFVDALCGSERAFSNDLA